MVSIEEKNKVEIFYYYVAYGIYDYPSSIDYSWRCPCCNRVNIKREKIDKEKLMYSVGDEITCKFCEEPAIVVKVTENE
jgi:hypothetical protein